MIEKCILLLLFVLLSCKAFTQGSILLPGNAIAEHMLHDQLLRIELIKRYIDSERVKGVDVLIAGIGKIVYNEAFGFSIAERKLAMRTDSIFRIPSQIKVITNVAVMMLLEEGKFLLDDLVSNYIPSFAYSKVLAEFNEKDTTYTTIAAKKVIIIFDLLHKHTQLSVKLNLPLAKTTVYQLKLIQRT